MDVLRAAFNTLIEEYDHLDGVVTNSARTRRIIALETVTASIFDDLNAELDPHGVEDLDDDVAAECLGFCLHVTDVLASVILDFHADVAMYGFRPEQVRGRLLNMLEEIWTLSKEELLATEGNHQ